MKTIKLTKEEAEITAFAIEHVLNLFQLSQVDMNKKPPKREQDEEFINILGSVLNKLSKN